MDENTTGKETVITLRETNDIVNARQYARKLAVELGFNILDQTKIVTAISELARNTVIWGKGGKATFEIIIKKGNKAGLRATFTDRGPGISDVEKALEDGYTSGGGLGLGLGGAKRLMDEFEIESEIGKGTTITVAKYK